MPSDQDATTDAIALRHAPDRSRYEIDVDAEPAGFAAYLDRDGRRIFFHTVVEERFGGRGLAGKLVAHALADTRGAGLRIVAMCPYVAKYVSTHHEVDDLLDPVSSADRAAVRDAQG
ncbi:GNAT family N-acetyltransferase [Pseudonocardia sp. KRD291]|uniref:GNAT family N-acetyltransferase n=1 Tax=Pseudonocardia sp. KRD291 TaxID=2792007 RepID=UPI001C49D4F8|nr:GNAT family N-acetyltransferase [Pseudonocardia sp. KRD291]MBW0103846.1 N-acetyltransferase [Pseudonocardia sp. KRD291]